MTIDLTLPMAAETLIPHRVPMRLVDTLLSCTGANGEVEANPAADCVLVGCDGTLGEAALVELLAQGYATVKGYDDLMQGKEVSEGYLVGVRKFRVDEPVRAGERLLIRIRTVGSFEGFAVAEGEIERAGAIVATGTLKLWLANRAAGRAAA